jgi:dTDP-4-dehydrorhamnose reductase
MKERAADVVAVIGAGGMLGCAVAEYFSRAGASVIQLRRGDYDIARDPLDKLEALVRPASAIVNCAGVIKPMIAGTPIEDVLRVNSIFPRNLARLGEHLGVPTFHVTTDCVYSGRTGGYTEVDPFDADDVYGLSKCGGDGPFGMVLRTSIIGEEQGSGRSLLEWARRQRGQKVSGFLNHRWNGVTTVQLAAVIEGILAAGAYERGVFHIYSPDIVTKFELLSIIDELYDLGLTIEPINAPAACDRSLASVHDLSARFSPKRIRRQIEEMRDFFARPGSVSPPVSAQVGTRAGH